MTKKVSLVLDEEQALFVSACMTLGIAVTVARNIEMVEACVEALLSMVEDGSVSIQTIKDLNETTDKVCSVFEEEGS